jgi:DNA-binding CsgD family transcriptional regulator
VGKTALAAAVAEHAVAAGEHVERLVATSAARSIPFGALAPLLPDGVDALHPALVLSAIRRRLEMVTGAHAPLLIVDDAHLLDDYSAATLLGLVTAGVARLVVTVRAGEATPDAVQALWKDGFVELHEIAPFDRPATQLFLTSILDGEVAAGTASLLWGHTQGNALYLTELARDAVTHQRLVDEHGLWMWRGGVTVPPRLGDLLARRFSGLSALGLDALAALVLGEPLPMDVLSAIATWAGVAELEARQVVETTARDGVVWYRFSHPMLGAAGALLVTPTRRQAVADALVAIGGTAGDVVRRAMWQLDSSSTPDVELLRAGASAVFLTQPDVARRLAERAEPHDSTPLSALLLADAHAELGDVDAARRAQALARAKIRTDEDQLRVRVNEASLVAFSDRRPAEASEMLAALRAELPARLQPDVDSMIVQLTAFSARPLDALRLADDVLAGDPPRPCAIRTTSARVLALAMLDRCVEALSVSEGLLADVVAGPATPYTQGIAHIAAQVARFVFWTDQDAPATDPSGRWPVPPAAGSQPANAVFHPLFEGGRRLLQGHAGAALPLLREAVTQQRSGEGLLRSEAVALLVVALAASGRPDEADDLLAESPPDAVAIFPGLRSWAESAVAHARGRPVAVTLAFDAYHEARAAGSPVSAVAYLAAASRYGAAAPAAAELEAWGHRFEAPLSVARALGIRARATGDAKALLEAAERHAVVGVTGDAWELSELSVAAFGRDRSVARSRATALAGEMRRHLRLGTTDHGPLIGLTRREREVATLAAGGMSDRDIAATLFISVRTVESHLAACYRKLGVSSRRGLRDAL